MADLAWPVCTDGWAEVGISSGLICKAGSQLVGSWGSWLAVCSLG